MIDQVTIDRILDAANIVDVVSEFVTLRKRGVNLVGLCPFHTDKTPSFYVSPSKNICKCFACGEGGTAVHFIMKHEQLSYTDSLRFLAKKYNIEIQERELTDREKQVRSNRESMLIVNSWAQKYFTSQLFDHVEGKTVGLRYFAERGFREDIIRKFQLGYSLDQRDALYKEALKNGYKKEFLEKTGLVIGYDNGNVNDRFRGRVMFPVHSLSGKIVAFGGRVLKKDEKTAKYVNSPESEIYHKSNELYGIYLAKQAIVRQDRCYLVEGYTDVISMHQAGIENVVASSGTALTTGQIRMIHRFTDNITVLYDGDAAGIKAAIRGIDLLLEEGMNVRVLLLPDGEDPDSFARKHNATEFGEYIREHETDFIRFKTQLLLSDAGNDPIKRSALISDIIRTIALVPDTIARSLYIRETSAMLEIDEQLIINETNKIQLNKEQKQAMHPQARPTEAAPLPEYPDVPGYPPQPEETTFAEAAPNGAADYPLPPPPDAYLAPPTQPVVAPQNTAAPIGAPLQRSPYQPFEVALLRYTVRYGEQVLFEYDDEETKEHIQLYVASYILSELEHDELSFHHPVYKQMLEEAAARCGEAGFVANRYFLSHPDANISRLAANLISEKYQLSKYHSKFRELEQEEDKLDQLVIRELFGFKDTYIREQIKQLQAAIKSHHQAGDMDQVFDCMKQLTRLNEIKNALSKQLGERIILKM